MRRGLQLSAAAAVLIALGWLIAATQSSPEARPSDAAAPPESSVVGREARRAVAPAASAPTESPPATAPATAQPNPVTAHGNKPDRDERWQRRMTEVNDRARVELGVDDATTDRLLVLQTELRAFKQAVRREMAEGLPMNEGAARIRERYDEFKNDVSGLVGVDRVNEYLGIVEEVRQADPGRRS
jgi:hypothetical protein